MKKVFSLMLFVTSFICLTSCSNDEDEFYTPQEVDLTLDYTFAESGSMTRATGAILYNDFYDKYIKTKRLTPTTYSLKFTNKTTGAVTSIDGLWKNKDAVRLTEGEYEVVGTSTPLVHSRYVSDTVFISFDETIHITKDMTNINLTAKYDSYLLMLNNENYIDARHHCYVSPAHYYFNLYKTENSYTLFVNRISGTNNCLLLTRDDGASININLENIPFEKAKYYYFDDATSSFDIPKMESGN
ncbi:MAG: hypothetical protein IKW46_05775 [Bacteroidaceae bacterium]|nr:hypothetical protein [Bacteroidaceae bacterium]